MKLYDQHLHSSYSVDGRGKLENYYKIALEENLPYLITTEHLDYENISGDNWIADYGQVKKELTALENKYKKVKTLLGIETGYREEHYAKTLKVLNEYDFDLVNLSVHDNGIYDYYMGCFFESVGIDKMLDIYFKNIITALKKATNYDVLSHFDYGFKTAVRVDPFLRIENYELYLKEIFSLVIKNNKALEINLKVQEVINSDDYLRFVLSLYKKLGGDKLTLSSDAHDENKYKAFNEKASKYIKIIKECGFNHLCYFIKRQTYYLDI